jgi:muramoyltetrapeptide carboxypeptidase LdcA involved in peptidoglycan recycling
MTSLFPNKLKAGDQIRVIAPSKSMGIISKANRVSALKVLENLGVSVTFGKHVDESDLMSSSSIDARLQDLHETFADPDVKAILTAIGGYNANQLLDSIDYALIQKNPKIFCGFSDITALGNAIYHHANLVTYSGVHFSSFAMQKGFEYSLENFKRMFFASDKMDLPPSKEWSDDAWYMDQENRTFHENPGYTVIKPGKAEGKIIGGNLGTLQLLRGTPHMPSLDGTILFLEEVANGSSSNVPEFDRNLQSLIQAPDFKGVQALVLGRFENAFGMTLEKLRFILSTKPGLQEIPIIAHADFGHTTPIFTFPIGGIATLDAETNGNVSLTIQKH